MNNPKTRQQWILDLLKSEPTLSYVDCWGKYGVKWGKKENTFIKDWKKATEEFQAYQKKISDKVIEETASIEIEERKKAISTKIDRLAGLEKQIKRLEDFLAKGKTLAYTFSQGVYISQERGLTALEVSKIESTIKDIRAEISKIEGDYAPNKFEADINTTIKNPEQVLKNLSEKQRESLLKLAEELDQDDE
ncbi:hypothetical protein [Riemerella anatipestifer]|uniref:hypothetical protein n=1 Tax=Riemerella anatipestifer TaxID=34085 RepID=UPI00129DD6C0|nr:hypothetical protein [Riemerella anatipestifer]MRM83377.1 hypothetical protein [Riemerella anatipestifer]